MAVHLVYFALTDVPEPLKGIQTNDNPDIILQAVRNHINSGKPESIEINGLDSKGTYTNTVLVRLSKVASVRVHRNVRSGRVKLSVTTSSENNESIKSVSAEKASAGKASVKKASTKKATVKKNAVKKAARRKKT